MFRTVAILTITLAGAAVAQTQAQAQERSLEADRLGEVVVGAEHCPYLVDRARFVSTVESLDIEAEIRAAMLRYRAQMKGGVASSVCERLEATGREMGVLSGG